ncbi:MAG TPA: hypothetical protein VM284_04485, partial [Candidatus Limnocylindria bacterium]|nr:hypothetical protein [Candidatus Limnocylindria bacterium]
MTHNELELRLSELATVVAFPPTPDLASAVDVRVRQQPRAQFVRRSLRRSVLLAALLALLVVGVAFALRYGLELLSITPGPVPTAAPTATHSPARLGAGLELGRALTLEEAADEADFALVVPDALGAPDAVYIGSALRGQVAFVYGPRDDLPASDLLQGAGLLITQNQGTADNGLA